MAGITGIGSGMDIKGMVDAITNAERAPKQSQLANLEKKTTTQLTSLGQLKSAISNFQSALSTLNSPSSFLARTATSSDSKVMTASVSQSAQAGSYKVEVLQLASTSKVALAAIDGKAKLNTGTLDIKVGDTEVGITIDSTNNTLDGMRDAINEAGKSAGVSATIITDDHGSRLVLSSSKAGEGNDITVAVDETGVVEDGVSLSELAYSGPATKPELEHFAEEDDPDTAFADALADYEKGGQTLATAQSAKLTIDGLAVTRDSNNIDDAVAGLSFSIKSAGSSTLTIAKDEAGVEVRRGL
jgi:flagellar hook-associated protein 2